MAYASISISNKGLRIPTRVVGASNSVNKHKADYICDGTADEVEINKALNSMPSDGGWVYLLEGAYNISSTITIPKSNVKLSGAGWGTKIQTTSDISMIKATSLNCTFIEDLYLLGAGSSSSSHFGIYFDNVIYSHIKRCRIRSCTVNVYFTNDCQTTDIMNCRITGAIWNGIAFTVGGSAIYIKILNNTIVGCGQYGILLGPQTQECEIKNNTITSNGYDGIYLSISSFNVISDNHIGFNSYNGIEMKLSSNQNIVTNNHVFCNNRYGIYLTKSGNNDISNNIISYNDYNNTATYDGINIDDNSNNNIISSNRCTGNDRDGIRIDDNTCDRNTLNGNNCLGNTAAAITDNGTNTLPNGAMGTTNLQLDDLNIIA